MYQNLDLKILFLSGMLWSYIENIFAMFGVLVVKLNILARFGKFAKFISEK